jgi:para-nitrobenzyl esterase
MGAYADVAQGRLSGLTTQDGAVRVFKGVPYAQPPVGDLRWRAPQAPAGWSGEREATRPSPRAPQLGPAPHSLYFGGDEPESEDCLYLNVWTGPAESTERPVMVWFHMGAFQFGSANNPLYNGEQLARAGATVITVNYRLGRLGFLAHPALTAESPHGASGNYGLMDQIAALQWVQENAEAFGGNPGNVTIFGLSAGAHSVFLLMSSSLARGLFHRAIAESGVGFTNPLEGPGDPAGMQTLEAGEEAGLELSAVLGVSTAEELRALPVDQLIQAPLPRTAGRWGLDFLPPELTVGLPVFDSGYPVIDGYVLPEAPVDVFADESQIDVPVLTGSSGNESSGLPFISSLEVYENEIRETYGEFAEEVLRLYPAQTDAEARTVSGQLYGDRMFTWGSYTAARMHQRAARARVYYYRFLREPPLPDGVEIAERDNARAFHGAELAYTFGSFSALEWPWEDVDFQLGRVVSAYWFNFARTGDPNGPGLPEWPVFDEAVSSTMLLDAQPRVGEVPDPDRLAFWDRYYARWHGVPALGISRR